uniref:Uncharacterized protein n=1 Tax=Timema monikensis TaxID=170555 RepID=A0A7R9EJB0_9NEOP|nr:unnamed protein product [Timema monikensis]
MVFVADDDRSILDDDAAGDAVTTTVFLLIYRKANAGELLEESGLSKLAKLTEISVEEVGVGGAKNFFQAKAPVDDLDNIHGFPPWIPLSSVRRLQYLGRRALVNVLKTPPKLMALLCTRDCHTVSTMMTQICKGWEHCHRCRLHHPYPRGASLGDQPRVHLGELNHPWPLLGLHSRIWGSGCWTGHFTSTVITAARTAIPKSSSNPSHSPVPWWKEECWLAISDRRRNLRLFHRRPISRIWSHSGFYVFKLAVIEELNKTSKFEEEIRQEQEERKRDEQERQERKTAFKQKAALFQNGNS